MILIALCRTRHLRADRSMAPSPWQRTPRWPLASALLRVGVDGLAGGFPPGVLPRGGYQLGARSIRVAIAKKVGESNLGSGALEGKRDDIPEQKPSCDMLLSIPCQAPAAPSQVSHRTSPLSCASRLYSGYGRLLFDPGRGSRGSDDLGGSCHARSYLARSGRDLRHHNALHDALRCP